MSYATKDELKKVCDEINDQIDDIKDNHLNSIEAAIIWLVKDIERLWKVFGIGIAILGCVIAFAKVFG